VLPERRAKFTDVDVGFGALGLSVSQTAAHGVPELHGREVLRGGLGVLGSEEVQHLWAVLGYGGAVVHELGGRRGGHTSDEEATEEGHGDTFI